MKNLIFLYILLELINLSFNIIPLWNFKKSSIDLITSDKKDFIIYEKKEDNLHALLTKKITKNNQLFASQNYILMLDTESSLPTLWEDIHYSYYNSNAGHFICPKGNFLLNQYQNKNFITKVPTGFNQEVDKEWDLICYYQPNTNYIFQGFLNRKTKTSFYGINHYELSKGNVWLSQEVKDGFLDFIWTNEAIDNDKYKMYAILLDNQQFYLQELLIQNNNGNTGTNFKIEFKENKKKLIDDYSTYTNAYFNNLNIFYYMSSNGIDEFRSGYSKEPLDIKNGDINNVEIIKNEDSPFYFLNKVTIKKMKMIRNTKLIYYEIIYNKTKNEIYSGIIDIELNKIIFNTNETLKNLTPITNHSMYAYTDESVYEICAIKDNNKCIEKCPTDKILILDTEKGNYCGDSLKCDDYILKPYNICIKSCDETYFIKKGNECGLCKNLYENFSEYRLINKECLNSKPDNAYYINEKMKIINYCNPICKKCSTYEYCEECNEGYYLEQGECKKIPCYNNCDFCTSTSEDENKQNCISCKENFFLNEEGNCLDYCPNGYYKNNTSRICSKCHSNCEKCSKGEEINEKGENQNCESCKSELKYLIKAKDYPNNCVNNCPEGTEVSENKYCVLKKPNNTMLWVFIILIGILLLFFFIFIYINLCKSKKNDIDLINEIKTELIDK